jgi:tetratricopeptide (TPR) repeat protein
VEVKGGARDSAGIRARRLTILALLILYLPNALNAVGAAQRRAEDGQSDSSPSELQTAIGLTRSGRFSEAIPRLLSLEGRVADEYAVKFNLALCYVATGQPAKAIPLLKSLPNDPRRGPNADNLLAQAYIGNNQPDAALEALKQAARKNPRDEKLFLYIADACMAYQDYDLGLKAMELGLAQLPKSAPLHYEKAVFLSLLDEFDVAKQEFDEAHQLAPNQAIGYVAAAHKDMMSGDVADAVRVAREGVRKGRSDYLLLTFLGQALLRSGAIPGSADFAEARAALEKAVGQRPNYADSQLTLAKVYLVEDRPQDALAHLETARELEPRSAAVYANLATAYRRLGDTQKTGQALSVLHEINNEQVARIANAPGDRKAGYGRTPH